MSKYKALLIDLDGTTVPLFSNVVSERVKRALDAAKEKMFVSIATGRPLFAVRPILEQITVSGLCVINNGGQLYDPHTNSIVYEIPIQRDVQEDIFLLLKRHQVSVRIYDGEQDLQVEQITKDQKIISFFIPDIAPDLLASIMTEIRLIPSVTSHKLFGTTIEVETLEITHSAATKQTGVHEVLKREGIHPSELIGVGDGHNDFPLLMGSGLKIAMGNAVPELKEIADFICPSVEKDGLAVFIEKFLL